MITSNVIQRTFYIRLDGSEGTCFTIDVDNKQYLVTARHLVATITGTQKVSIFHEGQWEDIDVSLVGHCNEEIDISVLVTDVRLSPDFPLLPTMADIIYGQDVFFLGFPYGMMGEIGQMNRNFPLPFVKKAIVSCLPTPTDAQPLFLDGHNNPGFSGGPVIFKEQKNSNEFKVAGVISGYRRVEEPIYQGTQELPLTYGQNTGIIISYGIKHAVDLIESNPIGFELNA